MGRLFSYFLQIILIFFLLRLVWGLARRFLGKAQAAFRTRREPSDTERFTTRGKTFRDPVCGAFVSPELSHRLKRGDETFHFCSPECRGRFQETKIQ